MNVSRFCHYRGVANGILNATRFATSQRHQRHQRHMHDRPPRMPSTSDQLLDRESAVMQRIEDIAESLVQVSIEDSAMPSQPPQQDRKTKNSPPSRPKTSKGKKKHKNERRPPSQASGGVPNPTQQYLETCNTVPQALGTPQNLLVVIDLNGTLLYRPGKHSTKFHARPHARLFLKYCIETFTVVIWSSARPQNVKAMCDMIIPYKLRDQVAGIWARDKFDLTMEDYNERIQCYKRLEKVWGAPEIAATHPSYKYGGRWDQTNTVLIDDSLEKARSEPHNLVEVPEWLGNLAEADDILPQVHDYLNYLSQHSNVSACLRAHPFQPHISGVRASTLPRSALS